jgi:phosphotransferase system  glucose/maltose/N-acetylglucosamine-specific IIC component
MAKDKVIGFLIFLLGLLVLIYYTWNVLVVAFFGKFWPDFLSWFPHIAEWASLGQAAPPSWYWFLALPIWLAMTLVLVIAIWIGWTMFTTPPPVPFEELEKEEEKKEKAKKPAKKAKK